MNRIIHVLLTLTLVGSGCGVALAHDVADLPAPGLLPDSPFYFIKTITRGISGWFIFGDEANLRRHLALAEEKLAEAHALADKGRYELMARAAEAYKRLSAKAEERLEKLGADKNKKEVFEKARKDLSDTLGKHLVVLERVLEKAPEAAKSGLENAIENAKNLLLKKMLQLQTAHFISIPDLVRQEQFLNLVWRVEAEKEQTIMHTAVHYDYQSHPGELGKEIGPAQSGYTSLTPEFAKRDSKIPGNFTAKITPQLDGMIYLRAHAIIDGQNYWSEEKIVKVLPAVRIKSSELEQEIKEFLKIEDILKAGEERPAPVKSDLAPATPSKVQPIPTAPVQPKKSFVIEGDDFGIYPAQITVSTGDLVEITFRPRSEGVYYGGLDFIGTPYFSTGTVLPGQEKTVIFTADKTFDYRSYWPASNRLKATGRIVVQL